MTTVKDLEGRPHYVVPVVMIRVGTWAGSQGPIFYPAPELEKSARLWNGRPVVVYHPDMYGGSTADSPEVFSRQKVGVLFNATFDGDKLRAEAWIDQHRVGLVSWVVRDAVRDGRPTSVSTGLTFSLRGEPFIDNHGRSVPAVEGVWPDHLAILPDRSGACSLKDGAGLFLNEAVPLVPATAW